MLDLCIISIDLSKYVKSLVIDKERKFTPHFAVSSSELSFTDHYSLLLTLSNLPLRGKQTISGPKSVRWNTNKTGGWEDYKMLTEANPNLDKVDMSSEMDADTMMKTIDKELKKVKHVALVR